jgi:hypothetical protein
MRVKRVAASEGVIDMIGVQFVQMTKFLVEMTKF